MEEKKRTALVFAISITVLVALMVSFGLPSLGGSTPAVVLPDLTQSAEPEASSTFLPVEITPQTVQAVVGRLARPQSYYRELAVTVSWEGGSATDQVRVWIDDGYTKLTLVPEKGATQYLVAGGDTLYLWYAGDKTWMTAQAEENSADLAQRIPTYESVLALDSAKITDAGYENKDGKDCIYIEVEEQELNCVERYWIESATGLLTASETKEDGQITYQMTEMSFSSPLENGTMFTLPDGTVLHQSILSVQEEEENSNP